MTDFNYTNLRCEWTNSLRKAGFSHSTNLLALRYLQKAETIAESEERAQMLIRIKDESGNEDEFLARLQLIQEE